MKPEAKVDKPVLSSLYRLSTMPLPETKPESAISFTWHIFCNIWDMLQKFSVILLLFLFVPLLVAQNPPDSTLVRYSPGYEFRDGIYMNPGMVMANRPIPPARIVSDKDDFDNQFYNELLTAEYIVVNNDRGVRELIKPGQLWGYAHKGVLYIQIGHSFQRLMLEGNLSRFIASATTYEKRNPNPKDSSLYTSAYYYRARMRPRYSNPTRNRVVYLLDLETNTMNNYTADDLEKILLRDTELLLEYSALKRSQRKKRQLEFIQRYNDRHPLYLPKLP